MSIFSRERVVSSLRNGAITVRTFLGKPEVFVAGYDQSTPYMRTLWHKALRQLPSANINRVLMLGLGIGASLPEIRKRFPAALITVVDWDPVMVGLFREFYPSDAAEILEGDAAEIVPQLSRHFELVLVDLYTGQQPAAILYKDDMVRSIAEVLTPNGFCILNAFADLSLLSIFERQLKHLKTWKYRYNNLALYQPRAH